MAHPITGPFTKVESRRGPSNYYGFRPVHWERSSKWYRQARPWTLPLDYLVTKKEITKTGGDTSPGGYSYADIQDLPYWVDGGQGTALNDAYSSFIDMVKGADANLLALAGERQKSMNMIESRAIQLLGVVRSLRRGNLSRAAKLLGIARPRRARDVPRGFGDLFLEYHYGWSPLISDIGSAVDVLQSGLPTFKARGKGSALDTYSFPRGDGQYSVVTNHSAKICAMVSVVNENLWLANRLGFINPALVAWELVPFSFVVDWFVDISVILSSFTDLCGVELIHPYTTTLQKQNVVVSYPAANQFYSGYTFRMERVTGAPPRPTMRLRPFSVSPTRAASAVSLLLQQLR